MAPAEAEVDYRYDSVLVSHLIDPLDPQLFEVTHLVDESLDLSERNADLSAFGFPSFFNGTAVETATGMWTMDQYYEEFNSDKTLAASQLMSFSKELGDADVSDPPFSMEANYVVRIGYKVFAGVPFDPDTPDLAEESEKVFTIDREFLFNGSFGLLWASASTMAAALLPLLA